jgi:hypothetical protein
VSFKQFRRTYPGNYSINFVKCLSSSNDFTVKNYSNFYLTNSYKISDVLDQPISEVKSKYIFGPISIGGEYLSFSDIDPSPYSRTNQYQNRYNYGAAIFTNLETSNSQFTIQIFDNNRCHIFFTKSYKKYYLCVDVNNTVAFCKESLLSFDSTTINPQDLIYLYSEDEQSMVLFKKVETGVLTLRKIENNMVVTPVIDNDSYSYLSNAFSLAKQLYTPYNSIINTSFINYNDSNGINVDTSSFDLKNNLLLFKNYSYSSPTDIIVLKNQLTQHDRFSTSNSLLTGNKTSSFSDKFREYTSIGGDVDAEYTEDLELNYVFYNKSYNISPGTNTFTCPSSMYPYEHININDTKIVDSGAFSYITPQYADKIYHLSPDPKNFDNGQYLLYTWLSGSPNSLDKIWVDRYYYPDFISKQNALSGKPEFNYTYDKLLENLIKNNSNISTNLQITKIFDKKSDLVFYPNHQYIYDRIDVGTLPKLTPTFSYCENYSDIYPYNYFKTINSSGAMSIGFNFLGDSSEWVVKSDRNFIDSGITIEKHGDNLHISYRIYDATNDFYDDTSNSWVIHEITTPIKLLKSNYVLVSVDSKTGVGYFFINDKIIYEFNLDQYQFTTKQLLYGDLFIYKNDTKRNLLLNDISDIRNVFISDYYVNKDLAFTIPLLDGSIKIDSISISLPCGMRNSSDNITSLQTVCNAESFKSNNINIYVKNLNITNKSILKGVKDSITTILPEILPVNSKISTIDFPNFK